jgi:methyl-accepting chemotaxis protein
MSIKKKLAWLIAGLALLFAIQAITMLSQSSKISKGSIYLEDVIQPTVSKNYELKIAVLQIQQWLTDISATRALDGLNDGIDVATENYQLAKALLIELKSLDLENVAKYARIESDLDDYFSVGKSMANAYIEQGPVGGNKLMGEFDVAAETINNHVEEVLTSAKLRHQVQIHEERVYASDIQYSTVIFSLVSLVFLGFLLVLVKTSILNPLHKLGEMARNLAGSSGDLSLRLDDSRSDELGKLGSDINKFIAKTQDTIKTVNETTLEIHDTAETVHLSASTTQNEMGKQLNETEQTVIAIEQITASSSEVTQHTIEAVEKTEAISNVVQQSMENGSIATKQISNLVDSVNSAQSVIERLDKDSESIGAILDTIINISEQTNLLALNAAIEAARAGEQGRGFAVVADEVRTLASRSQQSTHDIQNIVSRLRENVGSGISAIQQSNEAAAESLESFNNFQGSLEEIQGNVGQINLMNTQLASVAEEQNQVISEVADNIKSISSIANTNAQSVETLYSTGTALQNQVGRLEVLLDKFQH